MVKKRLRSRRSPTRSRSKSRSRSRENKNKHKKQKQKQKNGNSYPNNEDYDFRKDKNTTSVIHVNVDRNIQTVQQEEGPNPIVSQPSNSGIDTNIQIVQQEEEPNPWVSQPRNYGINTSLTHSIVPKYTIVNTYISIPGNIVSSRPKGSKTPTVEPLPITCSFPARGFRDPRFAEPNACHGHH